MTVQGLWGEIEARFVAEGLEDPEIEARLVLESVLGVSLTTLMMRLRDPVEMIHVKQARRLGARRLTGMPLAYVLGEWEFMGHRYRVGPGVLIPRPETELLVRQVGDFVRRLGWGDEPFTVLELGVGSGIVACELALAFPLARVMGWEKSVRAARMARVNAQALGCSIAVICDDFFADAGTWMGIIRDDARVILVSNPPYVTQDEWVGLDRHVRDFEPKLALVGGADGLDFYRRLLGVVGRVRRIPMVLEIGYAQGEALKQLGDAAGFGVTIDIDLMGKDRVVTLEAL